MSPVDSRRLMKLPLRIRGAFGGQRKKRLLWSFRSWCCKVHHWFNSSHKFHCLPEFFLVFLKKRTEFSFHFFEDFLNQFFKSSTVSSPPWSRSNYFFLFIFLARLTMKHSVRTSLLDDWQAAAMPNPIFDRNNFDNKQKKNSFKMKNWKFGFESSCL